MLQKTIRKSISCSGIGLHSGEKVHLTLYPGSEDSGLVFVHQNGESNSLIEVHPDKVRDTGLATTIADGESCISTIEHLLAAVYAMGIDNLHIEVTGRELPILDGSASPFVFLLHSAGLRTQNKRKKLMRFKKPLEFAQDGKSIRAEPYAGLRVRYTIDFDHPQVGCQELDLEVDPRSFTREIANARTFGFLKDVEKMQQMGLARGGSLENAVVLDEYGVVNPEGLRFKEEMVRHKVLDFLGDIAVMGMPLQGDFHVRYSGHAHNNSFLRYLTQHLEDYLEPVPAKEFPSGPEPSHSEVPEMEPALV